MWFFLGLAAIVFTYINLNRFMQGKDHLRYMALGFSFTALTLCAEYHLFSSWALKEDWAAIADVAPSMSKILWILTFISLFLNSIPVLFGTSADKKPD